MAEKNKTRDRELPHRESKTKPAMQAVVPHAPALTGAKSDNFEVTLQDIERTGRLPDNETLERRHPGVTGSREIRKEFMLHTIYSLRQRGYRIAQIAKALDLSEDGVGWYIKEIKRNLEREVQAWTFTGEIGNAIATFRMVQAEAARIASDKNTSPSLRMRAMAEVRAAERDIIYTLDKAKFFDNAKLRPTHSGKGEMRSIDILQAVMNTFITGQPPDDGQETLESYKLSDKDISLTQL
jgi:hypothetical protein